MAVNGIRLKASAMAKSNGANGSVKWLMEPQRRKHQYQVTRNVTWAFGRNHSKA
jgi:hypothetical protein